MQIAATEKTLMPGDATGRTRRRGWSRAGTARALLLVTLATAALRFVRLGFPPALTDEAFTFWRVCGTLGQLLDTLRTDGFVPLHYELVWLLTRVFGHDLWVLRLPAALAGTFMPYAVYRVTRPLAGRGAGVSAAVLAGASAFFSHFSRDAKMYMPAWLFLTMAVGSALRYGRTGTRLHLLTFTLFGAAAAGWHAVTLAGLGVVPVLVGVTGRSWRRGLGVGAALVVVLSGPILYYATANAWFQQAGGLSGYDGAKPAEVDNGLRWVERWQYDRTPANVLWSSLSMYASAYEWPASGLDGFPPSIGHADLGDVVQLAAAGALAFGMIALALAGARRCVRSSRHGTALVACATLLVIVPLYAFYLRSYPPTTAPWRLLPPWAGALLLTWTTLALVGADRWRSPRAWVVAGLTVVSCVAVLSIEWGVFSWMYAHAPRASDGTPVWNNLWMPRYSGFVAPFIWTCIGCAIAGTPGRFVRGGLLAGLVGVNLFVSVCRSVLWTEPPVPQQTADLIAALRDPATRFASDRPLGSIFYGLPGPYYALVRSADLVVTPADFRSGYKWPYRPGPLVEQLVRRLRIDRINPLPTNDPARRMIVWTGETTIVPPQPGWTLRSEVHFQVYAVTTWTERWSWVRREWVKEGNDH